MQGLNTVCNMKLGKCVESGLRDVGAMAMEIMMEDEGSKGGHRTKNEWSKSERRIKPSSLAPTVLPRPVRRHAVHRCRNAWTTRVEVEARRTGISEGRRWHAQANVVLGVDGYRHRCNERHSCHGGRIGRGGRVAG
jgi:hypothetical protein